MSHSYCRHAEGDFQAYQLGHWEISRVVLSTCSSEIQALPETSPDCLVCRPQAVVLSDSLPILCQNLLAGLFTLWLTSASAIVSLSMFRDFYKYQIYSLPLQPNSCQRGGLGVFRVQWYKSKNDLSSTEKSSKIQTPNSSCSSVTRKAMWLCLIA